MYKHLPKKLPGEAYERVAAEAARKLLVPGVRGVYLFGDAWQPGVSDMDLLLVSKDGAKPSLVSPWSLGEPANYIFTHRYLSMSETAAKKLFYLFPRDTTQVRLLSGDDTAFEDPKAALGDGYPDLIACVFFDLLVTKLLPMAGTLLVEREVDVRSRIGALYSLRYSEKLLALLFPYHMPEDMRNAIVSLRDEWFRRTEAQNIELLERLSKESVTLIMDMTKAFAAYTRERFGPGTPGRLSNKRYRLEFVGDWTEEACVAALRYNRVRKSIFGRSLDHDVLSLPKELSLYISWYAGSKGAFSTRMGKRWEHCAQAPAGAAAHADALNGAFEDFVRSGGANKIPYTYGFSPEESPARDLLARILRSILI